jgi:hypothetical protein
MRNQPSSSSDFAKKMSCATVAINALALLLRVCLLNAPAMFEQSTALRPAFEVASVKRLDVSKMKGGHEGHQSTARDSSTEQSYSNSSSEPILAALPV